MKKLLQKLNTGWFKRHPRKTKALGLIVLLLLWSSVLLIGGYKYGQRHPQKPKRPTAVSADANRSSAQVAKRWSFNGTVESVTEDSLVIVTTANVKKTIKIDKNTKVSTKESKALAFKEIQVGEKVAASGPEVKDGIYVADLVRQQ